MDPLMLDVPDRLMTPRLSLRAARPGDGAAVYEAVAASIEELRPWLAWAREAPTPESCELLVRRASARFASRDDLVFYLREREGDWVGSQVVGSVGLYRIDWSVPRFELGYWRRAGWAQRGVIAEAVAAITRLAFDQLGAQRVEARIDDRNAASIRVVERASFTFEGVLRRDACAVSGGLRNARVYARVRGFEEEEASLHTAAPSI